MSKIEIRFTPEKETPGTIKFAEVVADGIDPKVGTLYVKKPTLDELDYQNGELLVTIETAS